MDLSYLMEYSVPVIVGLCLCIGFVVKQSLDFIPNKYIPLIMAAVGLLVNVWINKGISAEVALSGMFSGLISTGLYELFRNMVNKGSMK